MHSSIIFATQRSKREKYYHNLGLLKGIWNQELQKFYPPLNPINPWIIVNKRQVPVTLPAADEPSYQHRKTYKKLAHLALQSSFMHISNIFLCRRYEAICMQSGLEITLKVVPRFPEPKKQKKVQIPLLRTRCKGSQNL